MEKDAKRARLYTTLTERLGQEAAETVMDALPPFDWPEIATKSDLRNLGTDIDARFEKIDARFVEVNASFNRLEAKIDAQFTRLLTTLLPVMALMFALVLAIARLS